MSQPSQLGNQLTNEVKKNRLPLTFDFAKRKLTNNELPSLSLIPKGGPLPTAIRNILTALYLLS